MIDNFNPCLAFTIGPGPGPGGQEGGYTDDLNDPGGVTNFGVSTPAWSQYVGRPATPDDIRDLTRDLVLPFYKTRYWVASGCPILPAGIDLMVFDEAVNNGVRPAAMILQGILQVKQDGIVGPQTALAARGYHDMPGLVRALGAAFLARYQSLPGWVRYGTDWQRRNDARMAAALAMLNNPGASK